MKWTASVVAAILALLSVFVTPVQGYIAAHPAIAGVLAGVGAIIAHLLPSPTSSDK